MSAYIALINFTEQGVKNVKDTVNRARAAAQAAQAVGGRFNHGHQIIRSQRPPDADNAPDDETATRLLLATAMQGNIRTLTMRAFSEDEMEGIVQGLP